MIFTPREYQQYAVNATIGYYTSGKKGNVVIGMPTGTGKAVVQAMLIQQILDTGYKLKIVSLTHVKELVAQNHSKMVRLQPTMPAGILSAGLKRWDVDAPVIFGNIQTAKNRIKQLGKVDIVLVDECHRVSPKEATTYRQVTDALTEINPHLVVIGLTATGYRMGTGLITDDGGLFDAFSVDMTTMEAFNWFIEQRYLAPLVPARTDFVYDVTGVGRNTEDYNLSELQEAVDQDYLTDQAIRECLPYKHERKHWLVFASGIEHAEHVTARLNANGITALCVHSKMSDAQRDTNISLWMQGKVQSIVNNGILTTGIDFPGIDMIVILRPTMSVPLWVQMLGRGTRPVFYPGHDTETLAGRITAWAKPNCLVMDFAHNVRRLGPINDPVLPAKRGKGGAARPAPIKECPICPSYVHARVMVCPHCGYQFPQNLAIEGMASTLDLIATKNAEEVKRVEFMVNSIVYARHENTKKGTVSLKVSYTCGLRTFSEWIAFENPSDFARHKAHAWWRGRSSFSSCPQTVDEALGRVQELVSPIKIEVEFGRKWPEVKSYVFPE